MVRSFSRSLAYHIIKILNLYIMLSCTHLYHSFRYLCHLQNHFKFFYYFFLIIRPPQGLLPVLGPLTRYMTPTLDAALLICGSQERGRTTSSRAVISCLQTVFKEPLLFISMKHAAIQLTQPYNTHLWT